MSATLPTNCSCKGIRTCKLCETTTEHVQDEFSSKIVFIYCNTCRQAIRMDIYESNSICPHHDDIGNKDIGFPLDGIYLVSDFLSENEEINLLESIDSDVWIGSQSGRLKQDFGIKINFKKQTIKTKYFTGMPLYSKTILERIQKHRMLNDFQSVELCNLDYRLERGSHIDPHIDDVWIWGERLITINLLSNTILSLIPNDTDCNKVIYIPLPRRWLLVLYGDARYEYKHGIQRQHISQRRLAVTFRELTGKNEKFYDENKDLYEKIVRIGKRFTGISVGRFEKIVNDIKSMTIEQFDIDANVHDENELKFFFETNLKTSISSFTTHDSSTYSITSNDSKYIMKLFSTSFLSLEQLKIIFSTLKLNETISNTTFNQSHIVIFTQDRFLSNKQIGYFLAQWRLAVRDNLKINFKNPYDDNWFNQQYLSIIEKKKQNYPFLLSNLYTCQQQLSCLNENHLDFGVLWTNSCQSYMIVDLVLTFLKNIQAFSDNVKEIMNAYEELLTLTIDEINFIDPLIRLNLVLLMNNNDIDDEKQNDLLEQLSSNIFFVRNLLRY